MSSVLEALNRKGLGFSENDVLHVVNTDAKRRYALRRTPHPTPADDQRGSGVLCIRANQGHSTSEVSLTFQRAQPPGVLYHGTTPTALESIMGAGQGLMKMARHHVHLSSDLSTAVAVGGRRASNPLVLAVNAASMVEDGWDFYRSENHVWLVDRVPAQYLSLHTLE